MHPLLQFTLDLFDSPAAAPAPSRSVPPRKKAAEPRSTLSADDANAGPQQPAETLSLITKLAQSGITVVLVEHDMHLVMGVSDHIVVLDYGRKLCEGSAQVVRNDPRVIEAYLGSEESVSC